MSTIFSKIISREIDAEIVYQDDLVTAFRDISPVAPTHILIVPNKEIATVNDITPADEAMVGRMLVVAGQIAKGQGIDESGYRLVINCGANAHQEVMHIHMHLVGGADLGPMLDRDVIRRIRPQS